MKSLKLVTFLMVGPTALGLAIAMTVMLGFPELRTLSDVLFAFGVGIAAGLVILAPIAFALAFRTQLRRWLAGHGFSVQWCASLLMAFSLGYLIASVRHPTPDGLIALALLVLFCGVLAKVVFGIIVHTGDEPPSSGGGGSLPPLAPLPGPPDWHPPGWHPSALASAAEVKTIAAA